MVTRPSDARSPCRIRFRPSSACTSSAATTSDASATGVNGQANPAGTNANPFLVDPHPQIAERPTTLNNFMTEQSTSLNGWIAGAIVSGAAGLAMLAASFRKAPVTVEV